MHRCFRQSLDGNKPVVSEEMFENVNRRRPAGQPADGRSPWTTDGARSQKLILSICSGELKICALSGARIIFYYTCEGKLDNCTTSFIVNQSSRKAILNTLSIWCSINGNYMRSCILFDLPAHQTVYIDCP